jgi:hypothetical protein
VLGSNQELFIIENIILSSSNHGISVGATGRGDARQDELLVREEEAIPGVGDRVTVVVASNIGDMMVRLSNGTIQTRGT